MIRILALALLLAACGGKKPAPATSPMKPAEHAGDTPHANLSAEMNKFHDVLAPRWHAEKGPKRMQDTCAALPEFQADADALAKSTPPTTTNADTWTNGTKQLVAAVSDLGASCKANDNAKFEPAFEKVHDNFHQLMALGEPKGSEHKHEGSEHKHEGGEHKH